MSYKLNPITKLYENENLNITFSFNPNFWYTKFYNKNNDLLINYSILIRELFTFTNYEYNDKISVKEAKQLANCLNEIIPNPDDLESLKKFFSSNENKLEFLLKIKRYYIDNYNYTEADFRENIKIS